MRIGLYPSEGQPQAEAILDEISIGSSVSEGLYYIALPVLLRDR